MKYKLYGGKVVLNFDPEKHIYTVNDKIIYGATSIVNVLAKPALINWAVKLTKEKTRSELLRLGGESFVLNIENILLLAGREHFIAHLILWKCFSGPMTVAFHFMNKNNQCNYNFLTSKQYENLKQNFIKRQTGRFISDETREKIGKIHKGKIISKSVREKLSIAITGKKLEPRPKEIKIKISNSLKNRIFSNETKSKMSESHKNKKHTKESKRKISESMIGRIRTDSHKQNLSKSLMNHEVSEKTKKKISESMKGKIPWNKGKNYKIKEKNNERME